jgi:hypothetical protein
MKTTFSWKVVKKLNSSSFINVNKKLFNLSPYIGLYKQFGFPLDICYIPQLLTPTLTLHQKIKNLLKQKMNVELKQSRFPYDLYIPFLDDNITFNFSIKLFFPNILSITIVTSEMEIDFDVNKYIEYQRLHDISPVNEIIQWIICMVEFPEKKNYDIHQTFYHKPIIHVFNIDYDGQLKNYLDKNIRKYIGVLIRHKNYEKMDRAIIDRINKKNSILNRKYTSEAIFIDKQGILFLSPDNKKRFLKRLLRISDLFEIAIVTRIFIDNFHSIRNLHNNFADFILSKLLPWIDQPEVIFSESYSNLALWNLLINELSLISKRSYIVNDEILNEVNRKKNSFMQLSDDWWNDNEYPLQIIQKLKKNDSDKISEEIYNPKLVTFINLEHIKSLKNLTNSNNSDIFILTRICQEINICYLNNCFLSMIILINTIYDYFPSIVGLNPFDEILIRCKESMPFINHNKYFREIPVNFSESCENFDIDSKEQFIEDSQLNCISLELNSLLSKIIKRLKRTT